MVKCSFSFSRFCVGPFVFPLPLGALFAFFFFPWVTPLFSLICSTHPLLVTFLFPCTPLHSLTVFLPFFHCPLAHSGSFCVNSTCLIQFFYCCLCFRSISFAPALHYPVFPAAPLFVLFFLSTKPSTSPLNPHALCPSLSHKPRLVPAVRMFFVLEPPYTSLFDLPEFSFWVSSYVVPEVRTLFGPPGPKSLLHLRVFPHSCCVVSHLFFLPLTRQPLIALTALAGPRSPLFFHFLRFGGLATC